MRIRTVGLAAVIACCVFGFRGVSAQVPATQAEHSHEDGHDHAGHSHGTETVAFTLANWKTMHFDDANKAAQHADMVKKLGCEIKQDQHAGHTDLSYRCAQWRTMEVADHKLAEQWIGWLKGSGFDVSHGHTDPSLTQGNEVVEFRLMNWKAVHGKGGDQDKQLIDTLKKIGCEVVVLEHSGHSDIKFRAPMWRDVHFAEHTKADQLAAWLKQTGFEVAPHKH